MRSLLIKGVCRIPKFTDEPVSPSVTQVVKTRVITPANRWGAYVLDLSSLLEIFSAKKNANSASARLMIIMVLVARISVFCFFSSLLAVAVPGDSLVPRLKAGPVSGIACTSILWLLEEVSSLSCSDRRHPDWSQSGLFVELTTCLLYTSPSPRD